MANFKLDKRDLHILHELDKNPDINTNQLAKKVSISRQAAAYRLKKLLSQNTIYAFYTLINTTKLGFFVFRVHIRLKNITREQYVNFSKKLFAETPAYWVAFVSGSFDVIYDVFAKNPFEYKNLILKIIEENKEIIQSYESFIILEMRLFQYGSFIKDQHNKKEYTLFDCFDNVKIDDTDKKILEILKSDCRIPYNTIGKKINLSRNAVKYRIKSLEKIGVICGYKIFIDFSQLNRFSYKIFIRYNNKKRHEEKMLLNFICQSSGALAALKLFGKWDLDIEIQKESIKLLQEFIMELRKFEIVEDYEIVQIIEELGFNWYPKSLQ